MKELTLDELKKPIQPEEIQWRVQSKGSGKTTVVPYLTNRCVMERFDKQFGACNWQNVFEQWREKGVKCGISVLIDPKLREWVTKYDGADETHIEPTKGGFSDSMKRAAVQWGLGRDLYDYPMIQIEGEHKYIPRWANDKLFVISDAIASGKTVNDYHLLKQGSQPTQAQPKATTKKVVESDSNEFLLIVDWIITGKVNKEGKIVKGTIEEAKKHYDISEKVEQDLKEKIQALSEIV